MTTLLQRRANELWTDHGEYPERIVAIEYFRGMPGNVITEEHWDHSDKPWFRTGKDRPNGTCPRYYDFNWSRNYKGLYWHNSGGGGELYVCIAEFVKPYPPPCKIWIADGVPITTWRSDTNPKHPIGEWEMLAHGYQRIRRPLLLFGQSRNPFEVSEGDTDGNYCRVCRDWLPDDGWSAPCEHMRWCDDCCALIYVADGSRIEDETAKCNCKPDDSED